MEDESPAFPGYDTVARELGSLNIEFNHLELFIARCIWELLDHFEDPNLGSLITAQLSFKAKLDLLGALSKYRIREDESRSSLDALVKKAAEAEAARNRHFHSLFVWFQNQQLPIRIKPTAKREKSLYYQVERIDTKLLHDLVRSVEGLTEQAQNILEELQRLSWTKGDVPRGPD